MSTIAERKIIVIVGPTASGKSGLAVKLAKKFGGEVISADSRQVYRGLDIGSAKITHKEMEGVRHHLLDVVSPRRIFTAADFSRRAGKAAADILRRGKVPIAAGGTGFYIDAMLRDASLAPVPPDPALRATLEAKTTAQLFARLRKLDPRRAGNIDPHNRRRLVRALEIILVSGRPVPEKSRSRGPAADHGTDRAFNALKLGLAANPETLKARINDRLAARLKRGLLGEVRRLHAQGISWQRLDDLGLEYRFASRHLRGLISREAMIAAIERGSWQYARRQMTWWRRDRDIRWVRDAREAERLARAFLKGTSRR